MGDNFVTQIFDLTLERLIGKHVHSIASVPYSVNTVDIALQRRQAVNGKKGW